MSQRRQSFSRGRWAVNRERLRIEDALPAAGLHEPTAIGQLIPALLEKVRVSAPDWLQVLREEWPTLVGAGVAAHTRPGRFEKVRLTVYVDGPVWLHELSRNGRALMLRNVQQRFGAARVREVVLQMDPECGGAPLHRLWARDTRPPKAGPGAGSSTENRQLNDGPGRTRSAASDR